MSKRGTLVATTLSHVLWLGGSQCAGKSTIAWLLAQKYGLQFYRYDSMGMEHARRGSPEHRAEFDAFVGLSMDERWLLPSPEETAERAIRSSIQRFPLVIEDLEAMSARGPVIAEGPGLYPQLVQPYMASPHHGIWLIPTRKINFECRSSRPKSSYSETSDPPTALQKLVERDQLLAAYVRQEAEELNLRWFEVDGSLTIEEVAAMVEAHFSPVLKGFASALDITTVGADCTRLTYLATSIVVTSPEQETATQIPGHLSLALSANVGYSIPVGRVSSRPL